VLSESTTTISSAHATDANAPAMFVASFFVITVTESFGTRGSVARGRKGGKGGKARKAGERAERAVRVGERKAHSRFGETY
jgi:hypothetical protein